MQEQKTDHKIDILNIIQDISGGAHKPAQVEAVLLEAQMAGISADEAQEIIQDLIKDRLVMRPRLGYIQTT